MKKINHSIYYLFLSLILFGYSSCSVNKRFYEKIKVEVISNSIIVPVKINGKTYNLQLDTGAPTSLSINLFDSLKLQTTDTTNSTDYYGNKALIQWSIIPEIQIGETTFSNVKVGAINPIQSFTPCNVQIDGYLGGDFFTGKVLLIDLKEKQVIITNQLSKLDLIQRNAINLKLIGEQNMPELFITFPSKKSGEYLWFDSGSNNHLYRLSKTVFNEMLKGGALTNENILYDLDSENNGAGIFGPQIDSINHVVLFDTIKIGETCLLNCRATTFDSHSYAKSKLGAPLLQKGIVIIDYINGKFYFNPYDTTPIDYEPKIGCYLTFKNSKPYVKHVIPGSIADRHNIREGFILKKLNSITFDSLTICDLLNLNSILISGENDLYVFKDNEKEIEITINN